ncbi:MAG: ABC transporter substrate-binding protein [Candidatus Dormibacteraceae bacterium]
MPSRRRLGAGLAAALIVACSTVKTPSILPSAAPARPATLRVAVAALPSGLDPATDEVYDAGLVRSLYESLVVPRPDLSDVEPAAAQSYEVSPDGLTYTFHLQPAGRWGDGAPVQAAQWVAGWRRILDPRVNSPAGDLFSSFIKNASRYATLDPVKDAAAIPGFLQGLGLRAPDDLTFAVDLEKPAPAFKWVASMPTAAPAHAEERPETGAGNGPFRLESIGKGQATLVASDHYWAGRARVEHLVLVARPDPAEGLAQFRSGEDDLSTLTGEGAAAARRDPNLLRQVLRVPRLEEQWMVFNVHQPPFDNPMVRLAFARAIDREALVRDVLAHPALVSVGPLPKGLHDFRGDLGAQRFDVTLSRATLDASGVAASELADVHLLVRDIPADRAVAEFFAAQVRSHLGIQLRIDALPSPKVSRKLALGDFQVEGPAGWIADYPDEQDFLDQFRAETLALNSRYSSSAYDHLVTLADHEPEPARRLQLYAQAQQILVQDAPVAFLYQPESWDLRQPWVSGLTATGLDDWPGNLYPQRLSVSSH